MEDNEEPEPQSFLIVIVEEEVKNSDDARLLDNLRGYCRSPDYNDGSAVHKMAFSQDTALPASIGQQEGEALTAQSKERPEPITPAKVSPPPNNLSSDTEYMK